MERPKVGKEVIEFHMPDGRLGHLVPDEHGTYETFVEPFSKRPDERLTPDQMADRTMNRITQGKRLPKYG